MLLLNWLILWASRLNLMKSWIDYNTKCKLVGWCNCTLCPGVLPLFDSTAIAFDMLVVDVVQADNYHSGIVGKLVALLFFGPFGSIVKSRNQMHQASGFDCSHCIACSVWWVSTKGVPQIPSPRFDINFKVIQPCAFANESALQSGSQVA